MVRPNYMSRQGEINEKMRATVINWLIEVHHRFKLLPATLFSAVKLMDIYLSRNSIPENILQLLIVACILIACKYEEIFSPEIMDFVCILDSTFEKEDIIALEYNILKRLKFNVTHHTSYRFFEILTVKFGFDLEILYYGSYLLELTLLDVRIHLWRKPKERSKTRSKTRSNREG